MCRLFYGDVSLSWGDIDIIVEKETTMMQAHPPPPTTLNSSTIDKPVYRKEKF
jgi:hypothetical protein